MSSIPIPLAQNPPAVPIRPDALPGPYVTTLNPVQESQFQNWVKKNNIPWRDGPQSDYDMRGFWQAQQSGNPDAKRAANLHFPDTWKTPFHKSFSNESQYANPQLAPHWVGNSLVDSKGNVVYSEPMPANAAKLSSLLSLPQSPGQGVQLSALLPKY